MRDDGKERKMKLRKLIQSLKGNDSKGGIGNRIVYTILDKNLKCNIAIIDCSNLKLGLNIDIISEIEKKQKESEIVSKESLDRNLMIVENEEYRIPIIILDSKDMNESTIKYLIIDSENKQLIKGRELIPWIFDETNKQLILWQNEIKINKEQIKFELNISKNRNILNYNDKNYVTIR